MDNQDFWNPMFKPSELSPGKKHVAAQEEPFDANGVSHAVASSAELSRAVEHNVETQLPYENGNSSSHGVDTSDVVNPTSESDAGLGISQRFDSVNTTEMHHSEQAVSQSEVAEVSQEAPHGSPFDSNKEPGLSKEAPHESPFDFNQQTEVSEEAPRESPFDFNQQPEVSEEAPHESPFDFNQDNSGLFSSENNEATEDDFWGSQGAAATESPVAPVEQNANASQIPQENTFDFNDDASDDDFAKFIEQKIQHTEPPAAAPVSTSESTTAPTNTNSQQPQKHKRMISVFASTENDPFFSNLAGVEESEEAEEIGTISKDTDTSYEEDAFAGTSTIDSHALKQNVPSSLDANPFESSGSDAARTLSFLEEDNDFLDDDELLPQPTTNQYQPAPSLKAAASSATLTGYNGASSQYGASSASPVQPSKYAPQPSKQLGASKSMYFGQNLNHTTTTGQETNAAYGAVKSNAFDLPGNIIPKPSMRPAPSVQNFHAAQPKLQAQPSTSSLYSKAAHAGGPPPGKTLSTQKSFFEELPSLPKKQLTRKQSHMNDIGQPPAPQAPPVPPIPPQYAGYAQAPVPPPKLSNQPSQGFGQYQAQYQPGPPAANYAPVAGRRSSSSAGYEPRGSHSRNSSGSFAPQDFSMHSPYSPSSQINHINRPPVNPYEPSPQAHPQNLYGGGNQMNQLNQVPPPPAQPSGNMYAPPHSASMPPTQSRYGPPTSSPGPFQNQAQPYSPQNRYAKSASPPQAIHGYPHHVPQTSPQVYQNSLYSPPQQTARTYSPYNPYSPQAGKADLQQFPPAQSSSPQLDFVARSTAPPVSSTYGDLTPELASSARRSTMYSPPPAEPPMSIPLQRDPNQPVSLNFEQARKAHSSSIPAAAAAPVDTNALLKRQFPLFSWGNGKTVLIGIPPSIAYGSATRMDLRVMKQQDLCPSADVSLFAKFPGPLVGAKGVMKSKKKELEKWIDEKIDEVQKSVDRDNHYDDRENHRLVLWKLLNILLKADVHLSKLSPESKRAIQELLDPSTSYRKESGFSTTAQYTSGANLYQTSRRTQSNGSNEFGSQELREIFQCIQAGEREAALRVALDKRLWGHALVIAGSLGPKSWNNAVSEFVREEVRRESVVEAKSLALLYRVFAGAGSDALTEVAPTIGPHGERATENLSNWKEYLSLIYTNRSSHDTDAIMELGRLLLNCGLIEAGHVCLILSDFAVFGSPEEPSISLVGSSKFGGTQNADSILMSEIYEFILLSNPPPNIPNVVSNFSHLIPYKLHHSLLLADYGYVAEAQKQLEVLPALLKRGGGSSVALSASNVGLSTGLNSRLSDMIDDLGHRLSSTDSNAGWFGGKLGKNKQWMQSFNKFVSGGEEDLDQPASADGDSIFKRLPSTPASDAGFDVGSHPAVFTPGAAAPPLVRQPSLQQVGTMPALSRVQSYNPVTAPYAAASSELNRAHSTTNMASAMSTQVHQQQQQASHNPYAPHQPATRRLSSSEKHNSPNVSRRSSGIQNDDIYAIGIAGTSSRPTSRSAARPYTPEQSHPMALSPMNNSPTSVAGTGTGTGGGNMYEPRQPAAPALSNPYAPVASTPSSAPNPYQPKSQTSSVDITQAEAAVANPYGMIYGTSVNSTSTAYDSANSGDSSEREEEARMSAARSSFEDQEAENMYDPESGHDHNNSNNNFASPNTDQFHGSNWNAPTFNNYNSSPAYGTPVIPEEEEEGGDDDDLGITNSKRDPEAERKKQEEEQRKAKEAEAAKNKGWFKGWFKGGAAADDGKPKAIRAKLGEERSLVFDKELKRWVDKNAPPEDLKPLAPPAPPKSKTTTPLNQSAMSLNANGPGNVMGAPGTPPPFNTGSTSVPVTPAQQGTPAIPTPANRPSTTTPLAKPSTTGGLDDLLATASTGRKSGARRNARNRYVDIMNPANQ